MFLMMVLPHQEFFVVKGGIKMSYVRTTWVSGETPLSAENMNNIEDGIEESKDGIDALNSKVFSTITGAQINTNIAYEKTGNICIVQIKTLQNLATGEQKIGTMPPGYRPKHYTSENYIFVPAASGATRAIRVRIEINGDILINNYGAATSDLVNVRGQLVYVCD